MDFKKITIKKRAGANERKVIEHLESIFKDEDFYFKVKADSAEFYLNSIDLEKFKLEVKNKLKDNSEKSFFRSLIEEIDKIKSYNLNGSKREYFDYNKERKVKDRKTKENRRGQYFYAKDHNFSKTNVEIPNSHLNKIKLGDSEEELKKLPDNCIDLIFTSPPYNFGLDYDNEKDDSQIWQAYIDKLFSVFEQCIRVLKYGGRIIVNIQPLYSDYVPIHHIITNFFINKKMIWKGEILWEKNNYNCKYTAWGSWKSPSNPYLKYSWEFLEVFCKGSLKKEREGKDADIIGEEFKKWVYGKWSVAPERKMKEFGHPAMFPENLVERVLKLFSFKDDVILDPFNGVGTTTKVSKRLGRNYLGIDVSEKYCRVAEQRLKELDEVKTLSKFF